MLQTSPLRRPSIVSAIGLLTIVVPIVILGSLRGGSTSRSMAAADTPAREVELITLRPQGFEPSEVIRSKGSFVLFIDDRSGKETSSLVLQGPKGEKIRAITINRKKSEWNDVVDLSPGTYVLQDASNSELSCPITILP